MQSPFPKYLTQQLILSLLLSSSFATLPLNAWAQQPRPVTLLRCVPNGKSFATIATRGKLATPPIIVWKPEGRSSTQDQCQTFANNFNQAVTRSARRSIKSVSLSRGVVKNTQVICAVTVAPWQMECQNDNILLMPRSDDQLEDVWQQSLSFAGFLPKPVIPTDNPQKYIDLGLAIDDFFLRQAKPSPQAVPSPSAP